MPPVKRWFPVSHDINKDPEVWELTDKFGLSGLRVWLEMLSIADRNDGIISKTLDQTIIRALSIASNSTQRHVIGILQFTQRHLWVSSDLPLKLLNYSKYHRTREPNKAPSEPSEPDRTKPKDNTYTSKAELTAQDLVDSWNESFQGKLPKVEWPVSDSRKKKITQRIREHPNIDFWTQVFTQINTSKFLLGSNGSTWRCTLDFLVANDTNCVKIYEGAYNHEQNQTYRTH